MTPPPALITTNDGCRWRIYLKDYQSYVNMSGLQILQIRHRKRHPIQASRTICGSKISPQVLSRPSKLKTHNKCNISNLLHHPHYQRYLLVFHQYPFQHLKWQLLGVITFHKHNNTHPHLESIQNNFKATWAQSLRNRFQLQDRLPSTPSAHIPKWRSTLHQAVPIHVNDKNITSENDLKHIISTLK